LFAGYIAFFLFKYVIVIARKIKFVDKYYCSYILRLQKKIKPYVETYGVFSLAAFVAIPIPGSGVYSAALISDVMAFPKSSFLLGSILGTIISGVIVVYISLGLSFI